VNNYKIIVDNFLKCHLLYDCIILAKCCKITTLYACLVVGVIYKYKNEKTDNEKHERQTKKIENMSFCFALDL